MSRFPFIALVALLSWTTPVMAEPEVADPVVDLVTKQGYAVSEVSRTWLGRILITARNDTHLREIVLNRRTGQVLRDQLFPLTDPSDGKAVTSSPGTTLQTTIDDATSSATGTVGGTVGGNAEGAAGAVGGITD